MKIFESYEGTLFQTNSKHCLLSYNKDAVEDMIAKSTWSKHEYKEFFQERTDMSAEVDINIGDTIMFIDMEEEKEHCFIRFLYKERTLLWISSVLPNGTVTLASFLAKIYFDLIELH